MKNNFYIQFFLNLKVKISLKHSIIIRGYHSVFFPIYYYKQLDPYQFLLFCSGLCGVNTIFLGFQNNSDIQGQGFKENFLGFMVHGTNCFRNWSQFNIDLYLINIHYMQRTRAKRPVAHVMWYVMLPREVKITGWCCAGPFSSKKVLLAWTRTKSSLAFQNMGQKYPNDTKRENFEFGYNQFITMLFQNLSPKKVSTKMYYLP